MAYFKICVSLLLVALVQGSPAKKPSFWKGTALDASVEEMRSLCASDDAFACLKLKVMTFLDTMFKKDSFQLSETVEINKNSYRSKDATARSEYGLEENVEEYIKSHDATFKLPIVGSTVTLDARNLDNDEVDLKLSFSGKSDVQARKSKLKKIFIPILVFVLLKAMTLIPLALGILGLKAWNALQLSFFSFVVSIALAVFQLCKKIAADSAHPQIASHGWESSAYQSQYAARALNDVATTPEEGGYRLAYSAYAPQE